MEEEDTDLFGGEHIAVVISSGGKDNEPFVIPPIKCQPRNGEASNPVGLHAEDEGLLVARRENTVAPFEAEASQMHLSAGIIFVQ